MTLHIIPLDFGGTNYNSHAMELFKSLGLDSQRFKKPPSSCTAMIMLNLPI